LPKKVIGVNKDNDKKAIDKAPKKKRRNKEKLSQREIEDLMGMNRDIYTRKNGAVRRK
jgi:hypothetical protein